MAPPRFGMTIVAERGRKANAQSKKIEPIQSVTQFPQARRKPLGDATQGPIPRYPADRGAAPGPTLHNGPSRASPNEKRRPLISLPVAPGQQEIYERYSQSPCENIGGPTSKPGDTA